jgi:hypothetical protein
MLAIIPKRNRQTESRFAQAGFKIEISRAGQKKPCQA